MRGSWLFAVPVACFLAIMASAAWLADTAAGPDNSSKWDDWCRSATEMTRQDDRGDIIQISYGAAQIQNPFAVVEWHNRFARGVIICDNGTEISSKDGHPL